MLDAILKSGAVSFEDHLLDVADIVLLGVLTGAWAPFERDVRRGLTLQDGLPGAVSAPDLKARATKFRYARRLLSAQEFTAWLTARSLSVADLSGVLIRAILRERAGELADTIPDEASADRLAEVLLAEAICGGVLERLVDAAVDRLAAAHHLGWPPGERDEPRGDDALEQALSCQAAGLAGLGETDLRRRLQRLWSYENARSTLRGRLSEPSALGSRVAAHGIDWLRLEGRRMRFATEDAAREASALMRCDSLTAQQVGELAGVSAPAGSLYLSEVPEAAAGALAATAPGEVTPPWEQDGVWNVLTVSAKRAPSVKDPCLLERAAEELLDAVLRREVAGRVTRHGAF